MKPWSAPRKTEIAAPWRDSEQVGLHTVQGYVSEPYPPPPGGMHTVPSGTCQSPRTKTREECTQYRQHVSEPPYKENHGLHRERHDQEPTARWAQHLQAASPASVLQNPSPGQARQSGKREATLQCEHGANSKLNSATAWRANKWPQCSTTPPLDSLEIGVAVRSPQLQPKEEPISVELWNLWNQCSSLGWSLRQVRWQRDSHPLCWGKGRHTR